MQTFIDLVQRHEQAFYSFVHKVHSKGEGLFDNLMRWIELFLTVVREGLGEPISLEFLLPHTGKDRVDILAEVDAVALYHYKLKVAYEEKLRRRFGKTQGNTDADAADEATQALVQGVVGEISFGELVTGDAADLAAEEEDESEDEDSSEYETETESGSEESSEESSEEQHVPPPKARPPTAPPLSPPKHRQQTFSNAASRPPPLSLRTSKSMTFSLSSDSSRRSRQDLPPVPPLPPKSHLSPSSPYMTKPLPPSPGPLPRKHSSTDHLPPRSQQQQRRMPASPIQSRKHKKKADVETMISPELHHVPKLLPVFTEMVSLSVH